MPDRKTILLVDDSENDLVLMRLALKKAEFEWPLSIARNGEEAIAYLDGRPPYNDRDRHPLPAIVLLDLNMPKKNGFDVLRWVREHSNLRRMPVIVLSASMRQGDVEQAFDLGANSFLVKPARVEDLIAMTRCMRDWLRYNHFPPLNELVDR